jgi:hypothetical protein
MIRYQERNFEKSGCDDTIFCVTGWKMEKLRSLLEKNSYSLCIMGERDNRESNTISYCPLERDILFSVPSGSGRKLICIEQWNSPRWILDKLMTVVSASKVCRICNIKLKVPGICHYCVVLLCLKCADYVLKQNIPLGKLKCSKCRTHDSIRL